MAQKHTRKIDTSGLPLGRMLTSFFTDRQTRQVMLLALLLAGWSPTACPTQLTAQESDELIVRATKSGTSLRQAGSSVTVLDGADLELQGFRFISDALDTVPGLHVIRNGGAGQFAAVFMRGEESYRTLVLIDGLEVSDTAGPQNLANFANVLVTDIDRIEVIRGPQALLYGADAIGGIIRIDTRRGTQGLHATGTVEYGNFATKSVSASLKAGGDGHDINVTVKRYVTDGFSAKEGDITLDDADGNENLSLTVLGSADITPGIRFEGVFRFVDAESEFDGFRFDPDRLLLTQEIGARANIEFTNLNGRLANSIAVSRFSVKKNDLDGGLPTQSFFGDPISRFDGQRTKVEYVGAFKATASHRFLWGGDYEEEKAQTDTLNNSSHNYGFYAEWLADWNDQLYLTAGVRFDDHANFGGRASYRATAAFLRNLAANNEIKIHASVGSGFRAPSLMEQARNVTFGLPPVSEEFSKGWDIGFEQTLFNKRATLGVTFFRQIIKDEIRFDNAGFTGYFQADGASLSQGVESSISVKLVRGLTISGAYTFTNSTVNSPDIENGLPRVRRPKHAGNVHIDYSFWQDRANINANIHMAANAEDGFLNFRMPLDDYTVVDLAASVQLNDHMQVFSRIDNVFNEQYQVAAGFQTSDIAGYVGIRGGF